MRPALLRAYRQTNYEVAGTQVRIGRRSSAFDRLLLAHRARQAVFITAHNPFSRRMPAAWNHRMQFRLSQTLRRRPVLSAQGAWRRWSEDHLVAFGDPRPTRWLARRFRQNSVVVLRLRQPAKLVRLV
jgi:hypothetical protein